MCAPQTFQTHKHHYYYCNRCGKYNPKGENQRNLKVQGSCKTGKNCLAHIKTATSIETGLVQVQYCDHHNHKVSLGHLKLPDDIKGKIASQLQQRIPADKIMDIVRDSISKEVSTEHIITKQDIRNIQNQYNIQSISRNPNDLTSVCTWVEEFKENPHNPTLLFKPQGQQLENMDDVGTDDFMLVLQTQFQLDMLKANGDKCICMVATYGVNMYAFMLISVLVIDEYGEGIPVAWAITNREYTTILIHYMKAIKQKVNSLTPQWFMSDDADQFFNAFRVVFVSTGTKKILCAWHIDRSWRRALRQHIRGNGRRIEIYHYFCVLY